MIKYNVEFLEINCLNDPSVINLSLSVADLGKVSVSNYKYYTQRFW